MSTPPVDAIARVLVHQDRELIALRSALAQQTDRAERAEERAARNIQKAWDQKRRAERAEATLTQVRELRDASYVHPDGYVIDRATLDRILEEDQ